MRRVAVVNIVASVLVVAFVVLTLAPAIGRVQRSSAEAKCQSNLQRWASAMSLYCADNYGCFPTNRSISSGQVAAAAALSPPDDDPSTGKPRRFVYSINWVEALYTYTWDAAEKTGQDWRSFRRCPEASTNIWPAVAPGSYPYSCVTYALNYNLIETPWLLCRNRSRLMMLREFWLTTISELRPANNSTGNSGVRPFHPFLNGDMRTIPGDSDAACKLHGEGSYIVFADGHVRFFTIDYYPKYADITAANSWDGETQQWWNYAPGSGRSAPYLKSIAITP